MSLSFFSVSIAVLTDAVIEAGVENVKRILADNFVRPDEAQKILSVLRSKGSHTVIDKITVSLNIKKNVYKAEFSNLGLKGIPVADEYLEKYDRLLCGDIWCIMQLDYEYIEEDQKNGNPIRIRKLTPIQMPHADISELKEGRKAFTKEQKKERLAPFAFSLCQIPIRATIEYCNRADEKSGLTCTVVDNQYDGKKWSLSALAAMLTQSKWGVAGPRYFKYNGECLNDIRKRLGV